MKTIYKYPIGVSDHEILLLPIGFKILCVQIDQKTNLPTIWALVDKNEKNKQEVAFWIYGTGHDILSLDHKEYIGTYQLYQGSLVFHVFIDDRYGSPIL